MLVSAVPTAEELRELSILIPTYFRLALKDGHVIMTLYAHGRTPPRPLVTYAIVPANQPDYAGPLLAEMIEDLAATVMQTYRAMQDSTAPTPMRILQIANDPPLITNARKAPGSELRAMTENVHSAEADDWFPTSPQE